MHSSSTTVLPGTQGKQPGPLFAWPPGAPVTRIFLHAHLKDTFKFVGQDPKLYRGHSFRIGAATWSFQKGMLDDQIKRLGRWKSSAF